MHNMWVICLSMLFCVFFDTLYTLGVYLWSSHTCDPQVLPQVWSDTMQLLDYFFFYYAWVFPLLYVFWPTQWRVREEENYNASVMSLLEATGTASHDSIVSLDEPYDRKPSKGWLRKASEDEEPLVEYKDINAITSEASSKKASPTLD